MGILVAALPCHAVVQHHLLAAEKNQRWRWPHQHPRTPQPCPGHGSQLGTSTGAAITVLLLCRLPTWCGVLVAQDRGLAAGDNFWLNALGRLGWIWGPGSRKGTEITVAASPGQRVGQYHVAQPWSGSRLGDGRRRAGSSAWVMALPKSQVRQRQAPSRTPRDGSSPYLGQPQVGEHPHAVVGAVQGAAGVVGTAQLLIPDAGDGYTVDGVREPEAAKEYLPLHPKKQASGSGAAPGARSGPPGCSHLQVAVPARRHHSR